MGFEELLGLLFMLYILGSIVSGFLRRGGAPPQDQEGDRPFREEDLEPQPFELDPDWDPAKAQVRQERRDAPHPARGHRPTRAPASPPWLSVPGGEGGAQPAMGPAEFGGDEGAARGRDDGRQDRDAGRQAWDAGRQAWDDDAQMLGARPEESARRELANVGTRDDEEQVREGLEGLDDPDWADSGRFDDLREGFRGAVQGIRIGDQSLQHDAIRQAIVLREVLDRPRAIRPYRPPGMTGVH